MFEKKALQPTVSQSLAHYWMSNLCPEKVDPIVLHDLGRFSHQFHWFKDGKIYPRKCVFDSFFSKKKSLGETTVFFFKNNGIFGKMASVFLKTTRFFWKKTCFWSNCKVSRCKFGVSLHQTYTPWSVSLMQTYTKLTPWYLTIWPKTRFFQNNIVVFKKTLSLFQKYRCFWRKNSFFPKENEFLRKNGQAHTSLDRFFHV